MPHVAQTELTGHLGGRAAAETVQGVGDLTYGPRLIGADVVGPEAAGGTALQGLQGSDIGGGDVVDVNEAAPLLAVSNTWGDSPRTREERKMEATPA